MEMEEDVTIDVSTRIRHTVARKSKCILQV